jgi:hypothetical protein
MFILVLRPKNRSIKVASLKVEAENTAKACFKIKIFICRKNCLKGLGHEIRIRILVILFDRSWLGENPAYFQIILKEPFILDRINKFLAV